MSSIKKLHALASATSSINNAKSINNNDQQAMNDDNEVRSENNAENTQNNDKVSVSPQASKKSRAKKLRALNNKLKKAKAAEISEKAKASTLTGQTIIDKTLSPVTEEQVSVESKNASGTAQTLLLSDKPASDTDTAATMTTASEDDAISDSKDSMSKLSRIQKLQKKKTADGVIKADVKIRKLKAKKHIPLPPPKDHSKKAAPGFNIFARRPLPSHTSRSSSSSSAATPPSPTSSTYQIASPDGSTHVALSNTPDLPVVSFSFFEEVESSDGAITVSRSDEYDGDVEEIVASAPVFTATEKIPIEADLKDITASLPVVDITEGSVRGTEDIVDDTQCKASPINNTASDAMKSNDCADFTEKQLSTASEQTTEVFVTSTCKPIVETTVDQKLTVGPIEKVADSTAPFVEPQREQNTLSLKMKKTPTQDITTMPLHVEFTAQPIATVDPIIKEDVLEQTYDLHSAVTAAAAHDTFVAGFLALPNGFAEEITIRHLRENMVAIHVTSSVDSFLGVTQKEKKHVAAITPLAKKSLGEEALPTERGSQKDLDDKNKLNTDGCHSPSSPYEEVTSALTLKKNRTSYRSSSDSDSSLSTTSSADNERKLFEARHTFVGIISLEEFMLELKYNLQESTATKHDVCLAFADCAAKEAESYGFRMDTVVYHDFDSILVQYRTKLGSKTLYAFLSGIPFDDEDVTLIEVVINGFRSAAASDVGPAAKVLRALGLECDSSS